MFTEKIISVQGRTGFAEDYFPAKAVEGSLGSANLGIRDTARSRRNGFEDRSPAKAVENKLAPVDWREE